VNSHRYLSQLNVPEVGKEGQEKFLASKVLVIGAGGLGCPALQYLAGMGIGVIGILDDDLVQLSNLHRQVLYNEEDVGKVKVHVAADKIKLINSDIEIRAISARASLENISSLISDYHIVVDCTDNLQSRMIIDEACHSLGIPLVFGAVRQFEGQVSVFNYHNQSRYSDFYKESQNLEVISCAQDGIMGHTAGLIGCLMTNEVVKIILGLDNVLSGMLLSINLLSGQMRKFKLQPKKS
jgi:sulfur-carrier protein adenylyltransferase/sulfurtransferase